MVARGVAEPRPVLGQEGIANASRVVIRDAHRHLVALPGKPTIGVPQQNHSRSGQLAAPFFEERREQASELRRFHPVERTVARREHIHSLGGGGEPQRREDTRMRWDDDGAHAERVGEGASKQPPGATERQQGHLPRIEPARHADPLERPRHHGAGDRDDTGGDGGRIGRRQLIRKRAQGALRGRAIEPHRVREGMLRVEPAQRQAGVGDGRPLTAAAVARRAGIRSGAFRPHLEGATLVHMCDAPAPGAHGLDQDRGQGEGDAGHGGAPVGQRRAARDKARVGACPTHVEREEVRHAYGHPDEPRTDDASCRARQRERRCAGSRRCRRERTSARRHHPQRRDLPGSGRTLESAQIGGDLGAQVRFDGRRAGALELAEQRQDFVARGDWNVREGSA